MLQRALAKDRESRYQTAADFSKALSTALTGHIDTAVGVATAAMDGENLETLLVMDTSTGAKKPTQAVPPADPTIPPTQYYPAPQEKRRGGWLIGALALVLIAALAVIGFLVFNQEDEEGKTAKNNPAATQIPTQNETPVPAAANFGQVQFNTTNVIGDTVVINTRELQQPAANESYQGWLHSSQENRWLALGTLPVDIFGKGVLTFTSPDGENLYTLYDGIAISLEPAGTAPAAPSQIRYSGVLLPEISSALQQILVKWIPDDPAQNPQELSLVDIASSEYGFAADHAGRALSGAARGSGPNTRVHGEHVYNILNGTTEDINGDNSSGNNPSNLKIGLQPALTAMDELLIAALNAQGISPEQQAQIVTVQTCAENALFALEPLLEQARQFANIQDAEVTNLVDEIQTWHDEIVPLGPGMDIDGDNVVEPVEGECGIDGIQQFAIFMNHITLSEGNLIIP